MNPFRTHINVLGPCALVLILVLAGCRGSSSSRPPIHISPNMDMQEKFEAQERNPFFADGRAMRVHVQGTVARGGLREDTEYYDGKTANGSFVTQNPLQIDAAFMERGRDQYEVFCAVCHGSVGDGLGIISPRGASTPSRRPSRRTSASTASCSTTRRSTRTCSGG